jgi:lipid A 3-O-deacylase
VGYRTDRLENLRWLGKPQVHAFVSINSENTSNFVATGFDWPIELGAPGGFYLRPGFGLAYTDGKAGLPPVNAPGISQAEIERRLVLYNTRIDFGSKVLFEPELALGYRFNDTGRASSATPTCRTARSSTRARTRGLTTWGFGWSTPSDFAGDRFDRPRDAAQN